MVGKKQMIKREDKNKDKNKYSLRSLASFAENAKAPEASSEKLIFISAWSKQGEQAGSRGRMQLLVVVVEYF